MADIFDNPILCKNCNSRMKKATLSKNRFLIRAVVCDKCGHKILHPNDEAEYEKFVNLRNKDFRVKMRLVGNSYSVSIPKEIVSFIREQERIMDDMVKLCFEEAGRLSLNFNNPINDEINKKQDEINLKQRQNQNDR
jgi:DNA-directed RNA polymerase subunit RPC12/RpoP